MRWPANIMDISNAFNADATGLVYELLVEGQVESIHVGRLRRIRNGRRAS
jgi:hypothetical protein